MASSPRVLELLEEMLESEKTPEEVCRDCPELLSAVRQRWQDFRLVDAAVVALLPAIGKTPSVADGASANHTADLPQVPGYELFDEIGRGGMGVVYRARQLGAKRLVALKMIRAIEHASPMARLRFQIETEAVARLQHPHIVQLYEAGEVRGQPFFSLELCDEGSLADQLKRQSPTPREAAALIETLARAMHYAHLRGVVHRDLKPGNVLLAGNDRMAKITDFGLAKRIDAEARDLSRSGVVMGTAAYMAPEQAAGKVRDTGPAADVYGLGALLYECLTGRPPFEGPQHVVLLSVLNDEPISPGRLGAKVPADLETVCLKCLRKEPARRYSSAEELADDLRRFQAGEPVRARPVGAVERTWKWMKRRPALAALAGMLLLSLASLAALSGSLAAARNDADDKRQAAEQEADKTARARDFLMSIFRIKDIRSGNTITARQILKQAEKRIPIEFAEQAELRDELLTAIADVNRSLDRTIPAAMVLESRGAIRLLSPRLGSERAALQMLLYPDDRLNLAADAQMQLVFLSDLHKERLQPGQEAIIGRKGCLPASAVKNREESVLTTFVRLPKGTFYMGWDGTPGSAKKTEIKEDFEIAVHDVTQGQWEAIMGDNPSLFSRKGDGRYMVLNFSDEELKLFPVESVSWDEAQEFISRLNEKEQGRGYWYRLPTEAEWEYACRGGATSEEECSYHYYFATPTNDLSSEQANFHGHFPFGNAAKGTFLGRTTRVGEYPSNKLGLCDMLGNVWQWCADASADGSERATRGGCFVNHGAGCQASVRNEDSPWFRSEYIGVRLVRVPAQ